MRFIVERFTSFSPWNWVFPSILVYYSCTSFWAALPWSRRAWTIFSSRSLTESLIISADLTIVVSSWARFWRPNSMAATIPWFWATRLSASLVTDSAGLSGFGQFVPSAESLPYWFQPQHLKGSIIGIDNGICHDTWFHWLLQNAQLGNGKFHCRNRITTKHSQFFAHIRWHLHEIAHLRCCCPGNIETADILSVLLF